LRPRLLEIEFGVDVVRLRHLEGVIVGDARVPEEIEDGIDATLEQLRVEFIDRTTGVVEQGSDPLRFRIDILVVDEPGHGRVEGRLAGLAEALLHDFQGGNGHIFRNGANGASPQEQRQDNGHAGRNATALHCSPFGCLLRPVFLPDDRRTLRSLVEQITAWLTQLEVTITFPPLSSEIPIFLSE
jgi:hypothetical protein